MIGALVLLGAPASGVGSPGSGTESAPSTPFPAITGDSASAGTGGAGRIHASANKALQERHSGKRLEALADLATTLSLEEIPHALAAAKELPQLRERTVFQKGALKRWSELAPVEAFAYIVSLPEGQLKVETIRFAASRFARQNARQAAEAATAMHPGRSRNEAIAIIAGFWARSDVPSALLWAQNLPDGFAKESALNAIRFVWVHDNPADASRHIEKLPPGDIKNSLITRK